MAEAIEGSVINWFKQLRISPQAIPPSDRRIRPVEPPLSVVVTMPVKREPKEERRHHATKPMPATESDNMPEIRQTAIRHSVPISINF